MAVLSPHPMTTIFKFPAVCAEAKAADTELAEEGTEELVWTKLIEKAIAPGDIVPIARAMRNTNNDLVRVFMPFPSSAPFV